ncbi:Histidine phosphatase [Fragilaria crotonensis]|nr:Histidine phosphatase [Fragilaria crotonensis]
MRMSLLTTVAVAVAHQSLAFTATSPKAFASRSAQCLQRLSVSSRITARSRGMTTNSRSSAGDGTSARQGTITSLSSSSVPIFPDVAPTAKRLFLVRHGEVINPGGDRAVYYGAMDVPLSPLGEAEAEAAAQYLQQFDLQHIACSPLSRARFGAAKVAELQSGWSSQSDLIVLDGFTEMDRGAWCGLTLDEIGPDLMARFDACDESVTPEGGESYPQLKNRVLQARDSLLEKVDCGRAAAVVSHLQVTRSILSEAMDLPISEMSKLKIATASITCIDYDGDVQTVHFQSFKPQTEFATSKDGAN